MKTRTPRWTAVTAIQSAVDHLAAHPLVGRRVEGELRELVISYGQTGLRRPVPIRGLTKRGSDAGHSPPAGTGVLAVNPAMRTPEPEWKKTACILCSINCGIEVQLGGEHGRHIVKVRGDDAHPGVAGLRVREIATHGSLPERRRPADVAAAPSPGRELRGDQLGRGDSRDRRQVQGDQGQRTAARAFSITAAADRATTSAAPTPTVS